ncbi:MAG: lysophospholipid acyltransferase family protein [Nitrospirota bacterium]
MSAREPVWRRLAPPLAAGLIRAVGRTMRIDTVHEDAVARRWLAGEGIILAFWHGRQFLLPLSYHGPGLDILISRHRDGELISRTMESFGLSSVRGSTTRGGAVALRSLIRKGRAGRDLAVTPDGPKGPRRIAQPGVIALAKATGLPIFPLTFGASKKKRSTPGTGSWCRTPSRAGCSSGESRYGSLARRTPRNVRRDARSWNAR